MLSYQNELFISRSLRLATLEDLKNISALENASYPSDEGASYENIQLRIEQAGEFFYVLEDASLCDEYGGIIGFVNGTCCSTSRIHHESMSSHDATGSHLVIHSVVVAPSCRRRGIARVMLKAYMQIISTKTRLHSVLLLAKQNLLGFYCSCGFTVVGVSDVDHGQDTWFELRCVNNNQLHQYQIDAFTTTAYRGNPAAVVVYSQPRNESIWDVQLMQAIAKENNLSETAFLSPILNNNSDEIQYYIRWFTPTQEWDLCGHATVAAMHCLCSCGVISSSDTVHLSTQQHGVLTAQGVVIDNQQWFQLQFPAVLMSPTDDTYRSLLTAILSFSDSSINEIFTSAYDFIVTVTPETFFSLKDVNFSLIRQLPAKRGVILTALGPKHYSAGDYPSTAVPTDTDFVSRCFFSNAGIDEDPVTGSAHCTLGPHWSSVLGINRLKGYQASERGGTVLVEVTAGSDRVSIYGQAVTVMKSTIVC